jgi:indole-3-glycerol phosphate synthase
MSSLLDGILARKREEISRRRPHGRTVARLMADMPPRVALDPLWLARAPGALPHVIAEIKHRSPSAGLIRVRRTGQVVAIASGYEAAGARAVSVLCDGPGFGGSILDVRRAASAVSCPILFKEFVLDELQLDLAVLCGARLILLIVRALTDAELSRLIRACAERSLVPVVEAADPNELDRALGSGAAIVGMNARDLRTFSLDGGSADRALSRVPPERVAIYMSGIEGPSDLSRVAQGRADAVLVGTAMMRAPDPGRQLAAMLAGAI